MPTRNKYSRLIVVIKVINLYCRKKRKIHRILLVRFTSVQQFIVHSHFLEGMEGGEFALRFSRTLGRTAQSAGRASEKTEESLDEQIHER